MARKNTYSYSWFKKRTAQLNKEFAGGRSARRRKITFSPKNEWEKFKAAQVRGETTAFVRKFGGKGDFRSARGAAAVSAEGISALRYIWGPFGDANKKAAAILDHVGKDGVFINPRTRRIFQPYKDDKGVTHYRELLALGKVKERAGNPGYLEPLTVQTASAALIAQAKAVKKRKAGAKGAGGGGGAYENYQEL